MEKQSEALRLAALLEDRVPPDTYGMSMIADELRRLHAENERLKSRIALDELAQIDRELGLDKPIVKGQ